MRDAGGAHDPGAPELAPELTIDRLVLRLAGVDEATARRIAGDALAALRDRLAVAGITGDVHLARVHLRITDAVPLERLPGVIADRIWEAIS